MKTKPPVGTATLPLLCVGACVPFSSMQIKRATTISEGGLREAY